jgi:hypothetical protein
MTGYIYELPGWPQFRRGAARLADYTRAHSDKFVRNGSAIFGPEETANHKQEFVGLAARIDTLADTGATRSIDYAAFKRLLDGLHRHGFFPDPQFVSASAMVACPTPVHSWLQLIRIAAQR